MSGAPFPAIMPEVEPSRIDVEAPIGVRLDDGQMGTDEREGGSLLVVFVQKKIEGFQRELSPPGRSRRPGDGPEHCFDAGGYGQAGRR